jgi:tripartite-type tricarboxylate transporter receptor subunit TctC
MVRTGFFRFGSVTTPLLAAIAVAAAYFAAAAAESDWPTKPVRVVVPYGPGGAADTLGRLFSDVLSTAFGKQFYVENRPGGGSVVGSDMVARAAPDGTTFILTGISTHVLAPAMNRSAGFDPMRDFTHVAYLGGAPNIFVVHPTFEARTFQAFMARARAEPDGLQYVSPGVGSVGNLVAEYLAAKESIKLTHVAYRGGAGALIDLVAGHVKIGMMSFSTAGEHVRAGKLVPLAVSSSVRLPDFPDVPTLAELGYPDLVATTWWAISAPAGLPGDITERVNRAIAASFDQPNIRKQLAQDAVETKVMNPAELTRFMQAEIDKWGPVAERAVGKQ